MQQLAKIALGLEVRGRFQPGPCLSIWGPAQGSRLPEASPALPGGGWSTHPAPVSPQPCWSCPSLLPFAGIPATCGVFMSAGSVSPLQRQLREGSEWLCLHCFSLLGAQHCAWCSLDRGEGGRKIGRKGGAVSFLRKLPLNGAK